MKTGLLTHEASFRTSVEDRARAKARPCNRARDSLDDVHRGHRPQRLPSFPLISRALSPLMATFIVRSGERR